VKRNDEILTLEVY